MKLLFQLLIAIQIQLTIGLVPFDLSHSIRSTDPVFPGLTSFNFTETYRSWSYDDADEGYFKALNVFTSAEHFGTHIDAPFHGSNNSWTLDEIPFERLVSIQALIVDVSKRSSKTSNYEIRVEDLDENAIQKATGPFVLLFYTGKSKSWPYQESYAGGYTREELNFPGLSAQLATHLVNKYSRNLVGVGIDTLSIDPGSSKHLHAHRILFKSNIYALENVASLDRVLKYLSSRRNNFFSFDVLPMKIEGGTGAPCRLVARLENPADASGGWFGFLIFCLLVGVAGIAAKAIYDLKFNSNSGVRV